MIDIVFEKALIFDWMKDFQGIMFIGGKEIFLDGFNFFVEGSIYFEELSLRQGGGGGLGEAQNFLNRCDCVWVLL